MKYFICLSILVTIVFSSNTFNPTFDDELYYEKNEIEIPENIPTVIFNRTTDILFRPWPCGDGNPGLLTRVCDCEEGIEFRIIFLNETEQPYRIGCCVTTEDVIETKMKRFYEVLIEKEIGLEPNFSDYVIAFDTPMDLGTTCNTKNGISGVRLTHNTCQALIGYIEKSDRDFLSTQVHEGCCPVYKSAKC